MSDVFIHNQARAWQKIVEQMRGNSMFRIINGASVNGPGSSLEFTKGLRDELPKLLKRYRVETMLDAPCGDFTWMQHTDIGYIYSYIGMDVDESIISINKSRYHSWPNVTFVHANLLTRKRFPKVDLILCRDFLAHLPNEYIEATLHKFVASGSTYLLASNYPGADNEFEYDPDEVDAPWLGYMERPHDLTAHPFYLPRIDGIREQSPPGGVIARDHELALFTLADG